MVVRTASLYVVGWWGVGNTAVGSAVGGIVRAEASSPSSLRISSPNAAQLPKPSSMSWILAMTMSTQAKRGATYTSKHRATLLLSSLCSSLASAFVAKVVARLADSWQQCLAANAFSAISAAHLTNSWWRCSQPTLSLLSPQRVRPTLGSIAPRPTRSPPLPQRVRLTLGDIPPWPMPTLPLPQRVWPTLSGVALRPMHPAGAACQPCQPKPLLALQLPVDAAPL
jgi:hypothetical protein